METWEEYYEGKRKRGFRFREEDVRITVEGSEYDETTIDFSDGYETFVKEYSYRDIAKAFKDFSELVKKDWSWVELRIESKTDPELKIIFNRFYFISEFIIAIEKLCKDSEKLKAIYKKIEEIQEILQK
ncbi:MAG: hypothetical protein ACTSPB_03460 [Candidatus Thorarchaeota archaeon]